METASSRGQPGLRARQQRALAAAIAVNGALFAVEVGGGILFGSLALLADAAHMLSDTVALALALFALRLSARPATARHTYGLQRAEVLGALGNGLLLVGMASFVFWEAARRIGSPHEVEGVGMLIVAVAGLGGNLASVAVLQRVRGQSLNMRGAIVHMWADAAGSIGAIAAGIAVVVWGADSADTIVSFAIGALVLWSAWGLLRETVHVLLEGTPKGMRPEQVEAAMESDPSVESVHHVHLWNLASDTPALSAHVVLSDDMALHDAQLHGDRLKKMLSERFGIDHATLEFECHACDPVYASSDRARHR